ncbi:MAG: hypothetical protein K9L68_07355 [Spirochaetales bacterium]|nr:hypothetical protein [Spirochaetales bacterium]
MVSFDIGEENAIQVSRTFFEDDAKQQFRFSRPIDFTRINNSDRGRDLQGIRLHLQSSAQALEVAFHTTNDDSAGREGTQAASSHRFFLDGPLKNELSPEGVWELLLPLSRLGKKDITGFSIQDLSPSLQGKSADKGRTQLLAMDIHSYREGFTVDRDMVRLSEGVKVETLGERGFSISCYSPEFREDEAELVRLGLEVQDFPESGGMWWEIEPDQGFKSGPFSWRVSPADPVLYLKRSAPESGERLRFAMNGSMGRLLPRTFEFTGEPSAPITDVETILSYPHREWTKPDFQVYSWSHNPSVLIFDTADYAVQARLFKRIAFYVEKTGYRGELMQNHQFAHLHGWNAHDYRDEDLARFFTAAAQREAEGERILNEEERELLHILLEHEVLQGGDGEYQPGGGCLISISRQTSPYLRKRFMQHELLHALFFEIPAYEQEVQKIWDDLENEFKLFWKAFFSWYLYDVDDSYLVTNEFQAYLMQQKTEEAPAYLAAKARQAAASARTDREADRLLRRIADNRSGELLRQARQVEAVLHDVTGFDAGDVETRHHY